MKTQSFIADDPVSLKEFFNDWQGEYTPNSKDNIFIEEWRTDIGMLFHNYYIGYFYSKNLLVESNKDFVDFYYAVKNANISDTKQNYKIKLDMDGIEEQGIILSKNIPVIDTDKHLVVLGASVYLSYSTDMQHGSLSGSGSVSTEQTYSMSAHTDYYYMNNIIYDLTVRQTYGLGYGLHFGLFYTNKIYDFDVQVIANNIASATHWNNLPFSYVDIETLNQELNEDGHVEYNPSISGLEVYRDYTQPITPRYHLSIEKYFSNKIDLKVALDFIGSIYIPYMSVSRRYGKNKKIELIYEHRFKSTGIKYQDKNFIFSIMSNGFSGTSALGASVSYTYSF